ncbi:hypothetical protein PaecuDRAFT_2886 [Paenibacillus curdlanolyticus YK9]|uniref:Uncharacterized protein n=1 Tax=Paenibacillus curdlanolyticus YK9 TaxID=717606 RepID=E0IAP6_9BACL|nr:hypothetical protein [Paenibacillus curdlanolyticus]EFM10450.1 hypothetical protein PaecuDRAFT_2886 [Paenibacillus curdlanolyticus YK9]
MKYRGLAGGLLALLLLLTVHAVPAHALDFAMVPLPELADQADTIVVGVPEEKEHRKQGKDRYEVAIQQVIKGSMDVGDEIGVYLLPFGDEGLMELDESYVLILDKREGEYHVAGVHQGFIRLEEDGSFYSRYYAANDVKDWLESVGAIDESIRPERPNAVTDVGRDFDGDSGWEPDRHGHMRVIHGHDHRGVSGDRDDVNEGRYLDKQMMRFIITAVSMGAGLLLVAGIVGFAGSRRQD